MEQPETVDALRRQMSALCGVFALSMMLFDRVDADEILRLVASAVPTLSRCRAEGTYPVGRHGAPRGRHAHLLDTQLGAFDGAEGRVCLPSTPWSWAYPLRSIGRHSGYLVVSADTPPSAHEQFLLSTLAQQAGAALNSAALYHGQRAASEELRERNTELSGVNDQLAHTVTDLERRTRLHESLTAISAAGGGAPAIAAALNDLTGLAVVVEDKFGNCLGAAGDTGPTTRPRRPRDRTELLNQIRRTGRPVRNRDRILVLAQPREEVLGTIALIDPERRAGQFELFALESAAVVLAVELAHQRSLAEMELRLRGDLVEDLLTGTDDHSAHARSGPLGHDLRPPHQVLVIGWPGGHDVEKLARAVDRAVIRITQTPALLTRRAGKLVVVTPPRDGQADHDWTQLHQMLVAALPSDHGAIGVGRPYPQPSELPRSYSEALRALGVRQTSARPSGVTTFEDLGFYRMLGNEESNREVREFIREWLGPLIDYDDTHHYDLVLTLWKYYECGGNYDATAQELMIHRSTLRYRLRRIRELSGHDLNGVDTRLNLHIATRAWQILRGPR